MTKPDSILYFLLSNFNRCTDKATAENEQTLVGGWLSNTLFVHIPHTHHLVIWLRCCSVQWLGFWVTASLSVSHQWIELAELCVWAGKCAALSATTQWSTEWNGQLRYNSWMVTRSHGNEKGASCAICQWVRVDNDSLSGSGGNWGGGSIQLEWKVRTGFYVLGETEVKLWILFVINSGPFLPTILITIR